MSPLVLIVDDEDTLRRIQARFLRRHGFEVREADSGPDGLRAALQEPVPDVIVMDIMLPGLDGVQVTRAIRAHEATARVPVVASTGAVLGRISLDEANFLAVLEKPYDLQQFLDTIRGALGIAG